MGRVVGALMIVALFAGILAMAAVAVGLGPALMLFGLYAAVVLWIAVATRLLAGP